MALYRLEAKIVSRKNGSRSVIASAAYRSGNVLHSAAYRSGNQLTDERGKTTFNYRARTQEVAHSEIMAPQNAASWMQSSPPKGKEDLAKQRALRERLWNTIEQVEKRKDSQLARDFVLTLARELTLEQQIELVRGWCEAEFVSKGFVVDFAIHKSKTGLNPHAHVLCTTRPVEGQGFGKKPSTAGKFNGRGSVGVKGKSELEGWRDSWEKHENAALEKAGRPERVDHRSLKDRGIDREPEPKMGPVATAMMRRGLDPERFKLVRYIKTLNAMRPLARAVGKFREMRQEGMGKTWWERSLIFLSQARETMRESVVDTWRAMLTTAPRGHQHIPPHQRGPDLER
jgi:ATP-dependent exoDNAse (exonuclease V) alpha subunit